ncbi:hypothetical protein [Melissococcus plutonius]|uniref:hypothetical protein n=1 Tax=Melissococcus plutonius TaxID=33970 RepID=UPI003C2EC84E
MLKFIDILLPVFAIIISKGGDYLEKIEHGDSKANAIRFGSAESIHQNIMEQWDFEDVKFTIDELDQQGFVSATPGSNSYLWVNLTHKAIACLEQKFSKKVNAALDFALKIKKIIF